MNTIGLALAVASLSAPLLAAPEAAAPIETPVYVAVCREVREEVFPRGVGMRIEVLGALEDGAMQTVDVGTVAAPSPIVSRIRALEWHYREPDGASGRAERFADARLVYGWNEPEEDHDWPRIGEESALLVLGACEMPGTVYATRAVTGVTSSSPNVRDDRRAREEILRAGEGRVREVVRVGDAIIGRGTVTPSSKAIESQMADYPEDMRADFRSRATPVEAFTLMHPALAKPLTIGEYSGDTVKTVTISALVTISGEEIAIVIYNHDAIGAGEADIAKVILLRTGAVYETTLGGSGC